MFKTQTRSAKICFSIKCKSVVLCKTEIDEEMGHSSLHSVPLKRVSLITFNGLFVPKWPILFMQLI